MAFDFENFGKTPETSLNNQNKSFDLNNFGSTTLPQEKQDYSGLGSSVSNFGKDIAQAGFLMFGGQKKIDKITQQYLNNASTMTALAAKQTDKSLAEKYRQMAIDSVKQAQNVGGNIIGKTRTPEQIVGDALGTLGWTVAGAKMPGSSTVLGRLGAGTVFGAGSGAQQALNQNKSASNVAKSTVEGGITGLAVSGVIEGVSAGLRALSKTNMVQKKAGSIYNSELQPNTKDLTKEIENNWKTLGDKIAEQVDENGKPIYVGGYKTMQQNAQKEIVKNSSELKDMLKRFSAVAKSLKQVDGATRDDIENYVINNIQDTFGILNDTDRKTIAREVAKLPEKMSLPELLDNRQIVDRNISSAFWSKLGTGDRTSFVDTTKYLIRNFLKEQIEIQADSDVVKTLNSKIGLAMDVKHLTALQQAIRTKNAIPGAERYIGPGRIIGNLLDKTIFSPNVRTRYAQSLLNIGKQTGSTLGRNIITEGIIQGKNQQ